MRNISWCPCLNTRLNFNLRINHAANFVVYGVESYHLEQGAHPRAAEDLPDLLHVLGLLGLLGGVQVAQRGQTVLQLLARVAGRVPRQSAQNKVVKVPTW